jgi:riboflavin kinase / FMN adenylyltransferase
MHLFRHLAAGTPTPTAAGRAVAVGVFDGLHLGHQAILRSLRAEASALACPSLVCSFEPMPSEFFAPGNPPPRLTRFRERYELLRDLGVDEFFCPPFASVYALSPQRFIAELLVRGLAARHVVVGHDFRFGAERRGTIEQLEAAGREHGFGVTTLPAVFHGGIRVSSTAIRAALAAGDLQAARAMLGRDYSMSGRVVRGRGLGRELGFPTANVNLKRRQAPVDGIFAVRVSGLGNALQDGVASVGTRPTIGGGEPLLEVHLFDFDHDIYGRYITVHFLARLREERHFATLTALSGQMRRDAEEARALLLDQPVDR